MDKRIILITGGVKSGKSRYVIDRAIKMGGRGAFLATAEALDDEMAQRIMQHRKERGDVFVTIEEPLNLTGRISSIDNEFDVVIVDCLTLWMANLMRKFNNEEKIRATVQEFIDNCREGKCSYLLVSNEVGWGIVPDNRLARDFRDLMGWMNARIAEVAHEIILMVAGVPVELRREKGEGRNGFIVPLFHC